MIDIGKPAGLHVAGEYDDGIAALIGDINKGAAGRFDNIKRSLKTGDGAARIVGLIVDQLFDKGQRSIRIACEHRNRVIRAADSIDMQSVLGDIGLSDAGQAVKISCLTVIVVGDEAQRAVAITAEHGNGVFTQR